MILASAITVKDNIEKYGLFISVPGQEEFNQ
jgi:hypothetical protein